MNSRRTLQLRALLAVHHLGVPLDAEPTRLSDCDVRTARAMAVGLEAARELDSYFAR